MSDVRSALGAKAPGSDDKGVAAVEFALVLPLLVVLLFTIVLAGSVYVDQLQLESVARNAARAAAVDPAAACSTATSELSGNDVGSVKCTLVQNCTSGTVEVRLDATQLVTIPLVGTKSVALHASSSFICEAR